MTTTCAGHIVHFIEASALGHVAEQRQGRRISRAEGLICVVQSGKGLHAERNKGRTGNQGRPRDSLTEVRTRATRYM
ncbi:hypothetical protein N9L68_03245 [bacterium]|nr:hypothetical protein [bacterium]